MITNTFLRAEANLQEQRSCKEIFPEKEVRQPSPKAIGRDTFIHHLLHRIYLPPPRSGSENPFPSFLRMSCAYPILSRATPHITRLSSGDLVPLHISSVPMMAFMSSALPKCVQLVAYIAPTIFKYPRDFCTF